MLSFKIRSSGVLKKGKLILDIQRCIIIFANLFALRHVSSQDEDAINLSNPVREMQMRKSLRSGKCIRK